MLHDLLQIRDDATLKVLAEATMNVTSAAEAILSLTAEGAADQSDPAVTSARWGGLYLIRLATQLNEKVVERAAVAERGRPDS